MSGRERRRRGYGKGGPWTFRGDAHYQFHLVPSKVARQYVPADMPLVECFGHTLGGFYYANYTDSPAGPMDELVVLSGLVWNAPTSCAWASHVFVDREDAVAHGIKVFGLPSHKANFVKEDQGVVLKKKGGGGGGDIVQLSRAGSKNAGGGGGPKINFQLPSFSGRTKTKPSLLRYELQLQATIQPCKKFVVNFAESKHSLGKQLKSILSGKALVSFTFRNMRMVVNQPEMVEKKKVEKGHKRNFNLTGNALRRKQQQLT